MFVRTSPTTKSRDGKMQDGIGQHQSKHNLILSLSEYFIGGKLVSIFSH